MSDSDNTKFYWCLRHERVETTERCGAAMRMGPYDSEAGARQYAETASRRDDAWEKADERWHGDS